MRNLKFEYYKVKREIEIHGEKYNIYRELVDDYGTPNGKQTNVVVGLKGLFHTSKGFITENISDGTKTHTKGQPMLMVLYDDSLKIENGDYINIGANKYRIVEKNNLQMYGIITDLSMELVLDDKN